MVMAQVELLFVVLIIAVWQWTTIDRWGQCPHTKSVSGNTEGLGVVVTL